MGAGYVAAMSTRLTYTSGAFGTEIDEQFESRLAEARATDTEPFPHLIAGEEVAEGSPFGRLDPCRAGTVASRAREATPELVGQAVEAAQSAAAGWRARPYEERCTLLRGVAAGIGERHLELAAVVSLETGKSRAESIAEVQEAADLITTYADVMERNVGYVVPLASFVEGERNTDVLRPYGVFGNASIAILDHAGSTMYHSLQTQLVSRFGRGSQFQASYTLSRTTGNVTLTGG